VGTNQFHGRVCHDLIDSALRARGFFEPRKSPWFSGIVMPQGRINATAKRDCGSGRAV
jgi:hypothetical protein